MELISGTLYFVSDEHSTEHASMGCRLGAVSICALVEPVD